MITLNLSISQFLYLRDAVKRDELELAEMAPWDIDCNSEQHERDLGLCREVGRLLSLVEQEQVFQH